ncbi:phage holin family protein [Lactococcus kimchii]|uniref:phage holin family protein n=1 Tax=Lactococcus sp. S-13 TaxID=2507158 RepID=UPI0010239B48|nr:phage holin family protein [Lactococcus sp. S-13]RZI48259.1 holin [Lactococcus sp. S-13]
MNLWHWIQVSLTTLGGALGWFFGNHETIYVLLAFIVVDYITGVLLAIVRKELSSSIGSKGIVKKIMIFLLVGIAHIIDIYFVGDHGVICTAVIFFYVSNEGISILENAVNLGLPVPEKLRDILANLAKEDK